MVTKKATIDLEVEVPDGAECYVDSVVVKYAGGSGGDHIVPADNQTTRVEWEEEE